MKIIIPRGILVNTSAENTNLFCNINIIMMALFTPLSNEVINALIGLLTVVIALALAFAVIDFTRGDRTKKPKRNNKLHMEPPRMTNNQSRIIMSTKLTTPTFNISDLDVSPVEAKEGESITISFRIAHTGGDSGCYKAMVQLDNRPVAEEEIALEPGEISRMTCTVTENRAGEHEVRVGYLAARFVIPNADIRITSLDIDPQQVKAGEPVTVKAELINQGGVTGIQKLELLLNGEVETTKEISVAPGKTELVTFEITGTKAGEHRVEVGDLIATFIVPEAHIKISALDIFPQQVKTGKPVTVRAELTNEGGITGTQNLELALDGNVVVYKEVTVAPVRSEIVTFELVKEEIGEHQIKIGDREVSFVVATADIKITALDINPPQVRAGETVTVKAELVNKGTITDSYNLELRLDGKAAASKEVSVSPEKSEVVVFEIVETKAGEHKVEVENLDGTFVIPEADIKINTLNIIPRRAKARELVVVKAELINKGGVTGSQKLELKLGDTFVTAQEFEVAPGATQKAIFYLRGLMPGTHRITINDISDEFMVYMKDNS